MDSRIVLVLHAINATLWLGVGVLLVLLGEPTAAMVGGGIVLVALIVKLLYGCVFLVEFFRGNHSRPTT